MKLGVAPLAAAILITVALLVGCGPAEPAATATPQPLSLASLLTPVATEPASGSAGAEAEPVVPVLEVTFDGSGCTVEGPAELPTGKHAVSLRDLSGQHQLLYVSLLLEGKTYQDLLDLQSEPGVNFPKPDFVVHGWHIGRKQTPDGAVIHTFVLSEAGEHAIYLGTANPATLWLCAPLKVVEAAPE